MAAKKEAWRRKKKESASVATLLDAVAAAARARWTTSSGLQINLRLTGDSRGHGRSKRVGRAVAAAAQTMNSGPGGTKSGV